jgi:hypothetical protein
MAVPPVRLQRPARDLLFFRNPDLWPTWPFLAVVRHKPGGEMDCGVLYDFAQTSGRTGYQCTVFLCNIFLLPGTEEELVALPREVFDTWEEVSAAGWAVD